MEMNRRQIMKMVGTAAVSAKLAAPALAQSKTTVRWWYHYDNAQKTPAELIAKFEKENPDVKIQAEVNPWGGGTDYINRIYSSIIAGTPPDCAQVRLSYLPRFLQMKAVAPLDDYLAKWSAKSDIEASVWDLNKASDGKTYFVPLHYVVIYLYYRQDLLQQAGVAPPKTYDDFLTAAKALTKDSTYGFGMRGGPGGFDNWAPFVLGAGGNFGKGGLVTPEVLAANRWYIDLAVKHKVTPPSAPTDAFRQVVDSFKAGRAGMIIHHIGSAAEITSSLGDKASAVPVPRSAAGGGWTYYGDESNAIFSASKVKEAAFRWISFLSTGENNVAQAKLSGQLPVTISGSKNLDFHEKRFVDASLQSVEIARPLPDHVKTPDFVSRVLPTYMQRALTGEISPDDMMTAADQLFNG